MMSTTTRKKQKNLQRPPMASAATLPFEVITEILLWLPVNSLCRFKSVSKAWRQLITDPDFAKLHHSRSIQSHSKLLLLLHQSKFFSVDLSKLDKVEEIYSVSGIMDAHSCDRCRKRYEYFRGPVNYLVGSSNGLICVLDQGKFALFNPFTRTHWMIPCLNLPFIVTGFGYDLLSYDYKVLVMCNCEIFPSPWKSQTPQAWLYSLNSNSWRKVPYPQSIRFRGGLVFVNNALYGLCMKVSDETTTITRFDIHDETYREVLLPPTLDTTTITRYGIDNCDLKLVNFEDCLCVMNNKPNSVVDVWVINGYGSWSKSHVVALEGIIYPRLKDVCRTGIHEILLIDYRRGLVQYDTRNTSIRKIIPRLSNKQKTIRLDEPWNTQATFVHIPTMLSVKSNPSWPWEKV